MNKAKDYIQLHLNILLFSLTSVFSKAASVQLNRGGIKNPLLYVFLFLMVANCGIYAIAWQKVIKKFSLSTAYANRSVYLIWSQIWAVIIFHENLTVKNIIGLLIVLVGVMVNCGFCDRGAIIFGPEFFYKTKIKTKRCTMLLH